MNQSQSRLGKTRFLPALLLGVLLLIGAGDDSARIVQLGHQMMCVCGCNQILLECNHVGCAYSTKMRDELVAAVDHGDNDNTVLQWFIQTYGTTVLATPTTTGFNRVAWIMPYFALVFGIGGAVLVVRAWRNRPLVSPSMDSPRGNGNDLERFREQARKETNL
jgi:cytochrome c-type biogenesis protein CcmH/NrfF